ncbi:MAG: hypothetical protein KGZ25_05585, partial [Planctomycetes bacterium]|nr:hypothetical protein [Planctomycetota bacterium]
PGGVGVTIVAYDCRPEILLPRTLERRDAFRILGQISALPIEGDTARALSLAKRLAAIDPPASIWHVTDRFPSDQDEFTFEGGSTPDISLETIAVPPDKPANVGITAFNLLQLPMEHTRYEAFLQLHSASQKEMETELEIRIDGTLMAIRKLTIDPVGRERLLIPVDVSAGNVLTIRLSGHKDILSFDNEIHARLPRLGPLRVLWLCHERRPFTEIALMTLGSEHDVEIYQGSPKSWPPDQSDNTLTPDVVLFDSWVPKNWPTDTPSVVINPPESSGPIQARSLDNTGLLLDNIRPTQQNHALLYGVSTGRLRLYQTSVLQAFGPLQPLWVGRAGPVMLAGEMKGQRIVVMGFDPERSGDLPLTASFPLLMGNALYWCAESSPPTSDASTTPLGNLPTGSLVELKGNSISWSVPGKPRETSSKRIQGPWIRLNRLGLFKTDAGEYGAALLLSPHETSLGKTDKQFRSKKQPDDAATARNGSGHFSGELTTALLWAILILLVLENWLYHRHAVY